MKRMYDTLIYGSKVYALYEILLILCPVLRKDSSLTNFTKTKNDI